MCVYKQHTYVYAHYNLSRIRVTRTHLRHTLVTRTRMTHSPSRSQCPRMCSNICTLSRIRVCIQTTHIHNFFFSYFLIHPLHTLSYTHDARECVVIYAHYSKHVCVYKQHTFTYNFFRTFGYTHPTHSHARMTHTHDTHTHDTQPFTITTLEDVS